MSPQQNTPTGNGNIHNPLAVMQEGEEVIFEVRRHPIGLLFMYGALGGLLIFFAIVAFIIVPGMLGSDSGAGMAISGLMFLIAALAVFAITFMVTIVYWGNHWIVSSDSLTQTVQQGLFRKKSAQLSLEHIEDVTSDKHGLLPHLFNYGTVMVETAGEAGKFQFQYCPNPSYYAQKILAAKENLSIHGHEKVSTATTPKVHSRPPVERLGQAALNDLTSQKHN